MSSRPFRDPSDFPLVRALEARASELARELDALDPDAFEESPDSLSLPGEGYDERGWLWFPLWGEGASEAHRARCPLLARAAAELPGMVNASLSLFRPGTELRAHRGELQGVLRCHLPLRVPDGDLGLRAGGETRRWEPGRALVFDDAHEHVAWNRGQGDRVVLIVTFRPTVTDAPQSVRDA